MSTRATDATPMSCFRWVKRDSYSSQGSQGLEAVMTAKYPIEFMTL